MLHQITRSRLDRFYYIVQRPCWPQIGNHQIRCQARWPPLYFMFRPLEQSDIKLLTYLLNNLYRTIAGVKDTGISYRTNLM